MKGILLLALLCTLSLQQTVLLSSSPTNTIVTAPRGSYTIAEAYYQLYHPGFLGFNAQWIYKNGTGGWPVGDSTTFFTEFYADCLSDAVLIITADDTFSVSLNGCT